MWEVESGRELRVLSGHSGWVLSVAFSPDGALLTSGSADHTVRLWNTEDGHLEAAYFTLDTAGAVQMGQRGTGLSLADTGGATANRPVVYSLELVKPAS